MENLILNMSNAGDFMAKRFVETSLIRNPWFQALTAEQKFFWFYLQIACDHAGVWQVNWEDVKYHIGIEPQKPEAYGLAIKVVNPKEWYLLNFVEEQQGVPPSQLNPKNSCHASIIKILENKNILNSFSPSRGLRGYSNGNSNGKTQPYTTTIESGNNLNTSMLNGIKSNSYNIVRGAVVPQGAPPMPEIGPPVDYTISTNFDTLIEEVATFRQLGFTDARITSLFITREIPPNYIESALSSGKIVKKMLDSEGNYAKIEESSKQQDAQETVQN